MRAWGLRPRCGWLVRVRAAAGGCGGVGGEFVFMCTRASPGAAGSSSPGLCGGGGRKTGRGGPIAGADDETSVGRAGAGIVRRMARAHPSSAYWLFLAALLPGTTLGFACTSDDLLALTEVDMSTTFVDTTMVNIFTTGEPDDSTSTGEPMIPEDTCRQAIMCITNCALELDPVNPPPEADYSCFLPCIDGLTTEEWLALIAFAECNYNLCLEKKGCPDASPDDPTCLLCMVSGLADPVGPPGCEMSSMTCE